MKKAKRCLMLTVVTIMAAIILTAALSICHAETLSLKQGWNFVSIPERDIDQETLYVTASIKDKMTCIWGFDNRNKTWLRYKPDDNNNTLTRMRTGDGYWIYVKSDVVLQILPMSIPSPPQPPLFSNPYDAVSLYDGWNLIGYNNVDGLDSMLYMYFYNDAWNKIWSWHDNVWYLLSREDYNVTYLTKLCDLYKGRAYWIHVTKDVIK